MTCFRLSALADLGLLDSPAARHAVRWLVSCQLSDGRWQEDPGTAHSAPVWARPGDPTASWYLTANAGLCVALAAGNGPPPDSAVRAANALAAEVSEAGTLPSYLVTHWLAAGLCWRTGRVDAAERLLSRLDAADPRMTAADWSWCGWTLAVAGVPAAHSARTAACQALADTQQPGGGWIDDEDGAPSVTVTLAALVALRAGVPAAG